MKSRRRLRVGAVNYLNSKPLIFGLDCLAADVELILDLPSRLADGLAGGRFDVALIPSIEYLHAEGYSIVSDACIACSGPVWSVKLFSRVPPDRISSLALDEGSRTSAVLVRILLHQRYGLSPEVQTLPIGATYRDARADAVLLIGDRAMHAPAEPFAAAWDLGEEWWRWTGLPFVFAMWVARADGIAPDVAQLLGRARDEGLAHVGQIAASEAGPLGLSIEACLRYLTENLHFRLGPRERLGLSRFYSLARGLGLAPEGADLGLALCDAR